jgi:hypothetical protein
MFARLRKYATPTIALLVVCVLSFTQTVAALSPEQKQLYDQNIMSFDVATGEGACGEVGTIELSGDSNAAQAYNYLVGQGLAPQQAAGVVANLTAESGVIPNRKQGAGMQTITSFSEVTPNVGYGIAQWTSPGRQQNWGKFAEEKKMDALSLELELMYLWHELETTPDYGLEQLKAAPDLRQATWIFLAFFERPGTVVDAGKAADPVQPTGGGAKETLDQRVALASRVNGDGGTPTPAPATPVAGTCENTFTSTGTLRLATFNIFHSDGEATKVWQDRLRLSMDVITSNDLDVVGLQEARQNQQGSLMNKNFLGGKYGIFPTKTSRPDFSPNAVIFNTSKWQMVPEGTTKFPIAYDGDPKANVAVQVKLRQAGCSGTCQEIYVINTHDPADVRQGTNAIRAANSKIYVDRIKQLSKEGIPIFLTGDFNSKYPEPAHCVISGSGVIKDTWEIYNKIPGCAKNRDVGLEIDRIYATPDTVVNKYWSAKSGEKNGNGSDVHDTIMNEFQIGPEDAGGGVTTSANGFVFPLKISRAGILGNKPAWCSKSTTNCHHDYNASDIFAPTGTPVLATKGGRVVTARDNATDPSAIGTRISIMGDDGWLYYYAHMGNNTLNVKAGQQIKAGAVLGKVGTRENAAGTDPHLHIDRLPGKQYASRPTCSGAACSGFPFDNIQAVMSEVFKSVK